LSNLFSTLQSCEEKRELFTELINLGLDIIMPKLSVKVHETDRPWLTAQLKGLNTRRQKALASNNESLYKILRNKVNWERKRCRSAYYELKLRIWAIPNLVIGGAKSNSYVVPPNVLSVIYHPSSMLI
jgi:hypothetical protein